MICGDCIHKEVCGLGGYFDDALITCTHKTELPHNTGHWIFLHFDEDTGISDSYWCSECNTPSASVYKNYCSNCGAKMVGGGTE